MFQPVVQPEDDLYFHDQHSRNRFESPYSIAHKFMWVNSLHSGAVGRLFGLKMRDRTWPSLTYKSLLQGDWIDRTGPARPPLSNAPSPQALRDHFFDVWLGHWTNPLGDEQLKVCLICLTRGFHSTLFQLSCLARCPLHRRTLTKQCPGCGRSLGMFALSTGTLARVCGCSFCNFSWSPPPGEMRRWFEVGEFEQSFASAVSDVERWVVEAKQIELPNEREMPERGVLGYLALPSHELQYAYLRAAIGPCPYEAELNVSRVRVVPIAREQGSFGRALDLATLRQTFRCIRRQLHRRYLRGYRAWLGDYGEVDILVHLGHPYFINTQPLIVLAYRIWRASIERRYKPKSEVVVGQDPARQFFTESFLDELDAAGEAHSLRTLCELMLSYFYGACAMVAGLIRVKRRELSREESQRCAPFPHDVSVRLALLNWYREFCEPYIGLQMGVSGTHHLRGLHRMDQVANGSLPYMMSSQTCADELVALTGPTDRNPRDVRLLERAVSAKLLPKEIFTRVGWPVLSTRARRRLRKQLRAHAMPESSRVV